MGLCYVFSIISLVSGIMLTIGGIAMLAGGYDALFQSVLQQNEEIVPGSRAEEIWLSPPVPLIMKVYFFNITNADQFLLGEKPIVEEIGPYSYREYHMKNVTYHENMTVTYNQRRWWTWDQPNSGDNSPDDVITTLNSIPVSASFSVEFSNALLSGLNRRMNDIDEPVIVRATASQILFDGYQDPILDIMQSTIGDGDGSKLPLPPGITDYDKFGWFYKRNNSLSYDGLFNMFTGESDLNDIGKIDWWNYANTTYFYDEPCNIVNGSAGELWPPNLQKDFIQFYSSDLCMNPKLYYQKEVVDSYGIPGYRFWGSNMTFANKTYLPANECYCIKGKCGPTGLLDAQTCRMGSPAFISFPHFMNADPALLNDVVGLKPDTDRHAFFIDINPVLGVPVRVAARMQINMRVKPYPGEFHGIGRVDKLATVPEMILPMIWFEVLSELTSELADEIKPALFFAGYAPTVIFGVFLLIGIIVSAAASIHIIHVHRKKKRFV